jgi:hypothetical protein
MTKVEVDQLQVKAPFRPQPAWLLDFGSSGSYAHRKARSPDFLRSCRKSTDLFRWNGKSPLQVTLFLIRWVGPAKGVLLSALDQFWLARLGTRAFADSRGLRSVNVIGNFTQIPSKIFQQGARISAVQHPPIKLSLSAALLRLCLMSSLETLVYNERKTSIDEGRRNKVCSMAQLRSFNHHRAVEFEDVFGPK